MESDFRQGTTTKYRTVLLKATVLKATPLQPVKVSIHIVAIITVEEGIPEAAEEQLMPV
jgi:hypothetical protein